MVGSSTRLSCEDGCDVGFVSVDLGEERTWVQTRAHEGDEAVVGDLGERTDLFQGAGPGSRGPAPQAVQSFHGP